MFSFTYWTVYNKNEITKRSNKHFFLFPVNSNWMSKSWKNVENNEAHAEGEEIEDMIISRRWIRPSPGEKKLAPLILPM